MAWRVWRVTHFDLLTCLLTSAEAGAESPEERAATVEARPAVPVAAVAAAAGVLVPARGAAKLLGWLRAGVSVARAARIASATRGNHVGSRLPKRSRAACGRVSNSVSRYVLLSEKVPRAPRLARYTIPRRSP
eukprot:scaffold38061_cov68-Phaeocystis_antarctica.AAC.2